MSASAPIVHLASRSPRRRQLLTQHGIAHSAIVPEVDDSHLTPGKVPPEQWVAALAFFKAAAARPLVGSGNGNVPRGVILGADTIVLKDGRIIGQPRDEADARAIIGLLENGQHEVLTGVALVDPATGRRDLFVDRARVRVGTLGSDRIEQYVLSGDWRGKAGGYNLHERIQAGWPIEYEGDPATIMGLPMRILPARLAAFGDFSQSRPAAGPA